MGARSYLRRRRYESMSTEELQKLGSKYNNELGMMGVEINVSETLARAKFEEALQRSPVRMETDGFRSTHYNQARSLRADKEKIEGLLIEIEDVLGARKQCVF